MIRIGSAIGQCFRHHIRNIGTTTRLQSTNEQQPPSIVETDSKTVLLFPGQGSQYVGMVHDEVIEQCPNAKKLFEHANSILGYNILDLCRKGPDYELHKTIHCQAAVFVSSLAAVERLAQLNPDTIGNCIAMAGFSIGELAALVTAGSINFVDALRFIKIRSETMQEASEKHPGGMMTVFYEPSAKVRMACKAAEEYCIRSGISTVDSVCSIANDLFPHCKVIAGHITALEFIEKNARNFGIKRIKRLPVSGAFHSGLMKPCRRVLANALEKLDIKTPKVDVYSNVDAEVYLNADHIRNALELQVSRCVAWEKIIHKIYDKHKEDTCPITFSCGPGNQMITILGMINLKAKKLAYAVES